ncbi:MAG: putative signal transduction protein [Actinomycetia bacterium]|nr:putative signal transduction protein [Actinomycetes bacterium]
MTMTAPHDQLPDPNALARQLDDLPAQHAVATQVLQVAGDNRASARDLADVLATDPAMSAQILKLANSAYYGMAGRVRNLPFAVTVVGFVSIHSLAAAYAAGALGADADVPDGFWDRAAAAAASASTLAGRIGVLRPEGLCLGLLHELGDFLLRKEAPEAHATITAETPHWDCSGRADLERELLGAHHGDLLAHSLAAWNFPDDLVDAIRLHPDAQHFSSGLARTITAGLALSALTLRHDDDPDDAGTLTQHLIPGLEIGNIRPEDAWPLSRTARNDAIHLATTLAPA